MALNTETRFPAQNAPNAPRNTPKMLGAIRLNETDYKRSRVAAWRLWRSVHLGSVVNKYL